MNEFCFEPLKKVKRGIIVDTDIGPDCDDVGALTVLHALAKKYDVPILGIINCTSNPYGCGAIDIINRFCKQDGIPVGIFAGDGFLCDDSAKTYNKYLSEKYNTRFEPVGTDKPEEAVSLYRRLLANAADNSVMLVTIGPLNTVAALLKSQSDDICPKDGLTLVKEKVYAVVTMAGCTESKQREYNIVCDADAAEIFINEMPAPVIYSGFELGVKIDSGFDADMPPLDADTNPVYDAYRLYSKFREFDLSCKNKSYDLTAVQFAFEGEGEFYRLSAPGNMTIDRTQNDATEFVFNNDGKSYFMDLNCSIDAISNELSKFITNAGNDAVRILNFGSLNIDHVYQIPDFVKSGETLSASDYEIHVGGKGLNQSIALAKAGAYVFHGGKIGNGGIFLENFLRANDVNCSFIMHDECLSTGHAIIQVAPSGENCIIIYGGSNQSITKAEIDDILSHFNPGEYILLQNEVSNVCYMIEKAHSMGMKVILNPSPVTDDLVNSPSLPLLDWVILNESEAKAFARENVFENILEDGAVSESCIAALKKVFPAAQIVLTLGCKGAVCICSSGRFFVPAAFCGDAVDTTGAGDTFTGYFFANIIAGIPIETAMKRAAHAAAISVTKKGASESIPHRAVLQA